MSTAHHADRWSPAGAWRLHPGSAMSLRPKAGAVLRVRRGRLWVTLGEPDGGVPGASGDRFLRDGDAVVVPAGVRLVMESLDAREGDAPVAFDWTEPAAGARASDRFGREVVMPSRDLVRALGLAGQALARVLRGLLGYGGFVVSGRGCGLAPPESLRT